MSFRHPMDQTPRPIRLRLPRRRKEIPMNSLTLVGALTKDPELKGAEESRVCRLRLVEANGHSDHPLYINVSVFGAQGEACAEHLGKGRQVAVVGRLCFREWQRVDTSRRSEHWILADRVDFLPRTAAAPLEAATAPAED
jgi:single stranded DNA-binding protein